MRVASSCAFSSVRLATISRLTRLSTRWRAASSMVSPAPISSTQACLRSVHTCSASRTAVNATETVCAPMRVSVRTRLATAKVCCSRRSSGAPSARVACELVGILHLAQDLRLAQHHRVQPRGDAEHVSHCRVLVMPVEELVQLARGQAVVAVEPRLRRLFGTFGYADVKLGAVAGGEDQRFFNARLGLQLAQGFSGGVRIERHLFAQADRRGEVIEPEGDQRHGEECELTTGYPRRRRLGFRVPGAIRSHL